MCRKIITGHRFFDGCGHAVHIHVTFVETRQHVFDVFLHCFRCDAMLFVIRDLLGAAAFGFAHGAFHAAGNFIRIHDHAAFGVSSRAADGLHQ